MSQELTNMLTAEYNDSISSLLQSLEKKYGVTVVGHFASLFTNEDQATFSMRQTQAMPGDVRLHQMWLLLSLIAQTTADSRVPAVAEQINELLTQLSAYTVGPQPLSTVH